MTSKFGFPQNSLEESPATDYLNNLEDGSFFVKGQQTQLLIRLIPGLDMAEIDRRLHEFTENQLFNFRISDMGSLAFDVVFSPGIIPKTSQPEYRTAYQEYFNSLYQFPIFDESGYFVFPEISSVQPNLEDRRQYDNFIIEWVANLRAVAMMRQTLLREFNTDSIVTNNLTEAVMCRMAENGENWPEELFRNLSIAAEERLDHLREEITQKRLQGYVLAPGQFFRAANLLEFREQIMSKDSLHGRRITIMNMINEAAESKRPSSNPPASIAPVSAPRSTIMKYVPQTEISHFSDRQKRSVLLSSLMNRPEHVRSWAKLLLGQSAKLK